MVLVVCQCCCRCKNCEGGSEAGVFLGVWLAWHGNKPHGSLAARYVGLCPVRCLYPGVGKHASGRISSSTGLHCTLDEDTAHTSAKQTLPLVWHAVTLTPWPLCAALNNGVCFRGTALRWEGA